MVRPLNSCFFKYVLNPSKSSRFTSLTFKRLHDSRNNSRPRLYAAQVAGDLFASISARKTATGRSLRSFSSSVAWSDFHTTRQRLPNVLLLFRLYLRCREVRASKPNPLLVATLVANVKRGLLTGVGYGTALHLERRPMHARCIPYRSQKCVFAGYIWGFVRAWDSVNLNDPFTVPLKYTNYNSTQFYWDFEAMAERGGFEPPVGVLAPTTV